LAEFNTSKGVRTSAYSPLGGQVPGATRLAERPEIVEVAKKLGRTPGQVILRWNLQRGIAVLPKTATPSRLAENLDLDFEIPEAEMECINSMGGQARQRDTTTKDSAYNVASFLHPEGPYKTQADLGDN